jgi:hypothetical protein
LDEKIVGMETNAPPPPLDAANRGFRLLQKMGWRPGTGLGRQEQGGLVVAVLVASGGSSGGLRQGSSSRCG